MAVLCFAAAIAAGCTPSPGDTGASDAGSDGGSSPALTWYRDVQPFFAARCTGCHRPGGIAPFSLETLEDVVPLIDLVRDSVENERMPPWLPDDGCRPLRDSRHLAPDERALLAEWIDLGMPEGDPRDAPEPPPPPALEWVDLELDPGLDYTPNDQGQNDDYHCFILDPKLEGPAQIIGLEFVPGTPSMVHHILLFKSTREEARDLDAQEPGPGWTCFGAPGTAVPETVGGWAPGTPITRYPEGTGVALSERDVILMQVHYNFDNGPAVADRTTVRVQLADDPVDEALLVPLLDMDFRIPPKSTDVRTTVSFQAPFDLTIYGMFPHLHQLGRSLRATLERGGGGTECLIDVPRWDFNWQQFYFFAEPVHVKKDDWVHVECAWDNPTDRTVRWGEGTHDEMCLDYTYVTID